MCNLIQSTHFHCCFEKSGWGDLLEEFELGSEFLMEVDLPIIGMKQCKESYSKGELKRQVVKEQICAGYPNGGKDSCQVTERII